MPRLRSRFATALARVHPMPVRCRSVPIAPSTHRRPSRCYPPRVPQRRALPLRCAALSALPILAALLVEGGASAAGTVTVSTPQIAQKAPECAPLFKTTVGSGASSVTNIWEAAKLPALSSDCSSLQLGVDAFRDQKYAAALDYAQKAELDTPGQAGPWVVRGEAYARWGRSQDAAAAFEKARAIQPRSLDDAETLDDYGSVLVRLGQADDARRIYRALLPRVSGAQGLCGLRATCDAAGLAYLTAGALSLELGTPALDEAIAILREARGKSDVDRDVRRVASLALALALDRRGDADQAIDLAGEIAKTRGIPTEINGEITVRLIAPEEAIAMRAIGLEQSDTVAALEAWKAYLAAGGDKRVWAAHAKAHVAALEKPKKKVP